MFLLHQFQNSSLKYEQIQSPVTQDGCKTVSGWELVDDQSDVYFVDWLETLQLLLYFML